LSSSSVHYLLFTRSYVVIRWEYKVFDALSVASLFELYQLRQQVFIIEQQCIYEDIDASDKTALHVLGWDDGTCAKPALSAYLRIMDLHVNSEMVSIGRVVVATVCRRSGVGTRLLHTALSCIESIAPQAPITLSAQCHLTGFYQALGFVVASEPYDEDGILHVRMFKIP
jgi:ElaA protein